MTAHHDDPDRIRAELEERFIREMKDMFDEVDYPPESRRQEEVKERLRDEIRRFV